MDEAGYESRSYFWLDKEYASGFAIVTHIEQIHPDVTPVSKGRWSFDLPSYETLSIATLLKWLIKADPGNYRMIALVVSKVQFEEKNEPMTQAQSDAAATTTTTTTRTMTARRGSFLIVLGVVVALGPPARKAIDDEDDDENGKTRDFPDRPGGRRRARSAGEESNR